MSKCNCFHCDPPKESDLGDSAYFGVFTENNWDHALSVNSLHVELTPATFTISTDPEKPTKYKITNPEKKEQEVFVACVSYIFCIRNPTAKKDTVTQIYCCLKPNECLDFEIGLKDPKELTLQDIPPSFTPYGHLEISHYNHHKREVKKNEWMSFMKRQGEYHGHWREDLVADKETEYVKAKKLEFRGLVQKHYDEIEEKNYARYKENTPMTVVPVFTEDEPPKVEEPPKKSEKKDPVVSMQVQPKKKKKFLGCC